MGKPDVIIIEEPRVPFAIPIPFTDIGWVNIAPVLVSGLAILNISVRKWRKKQTEGYPI